MNSKSGLLVFLLTVFLLPFVGNVSTATAGSGNCWSKSGQSMADAARQGQATCESQGGRWVSVDPPSGAPGMPGGPGGMPGMPGGPGGPGGMPGMPGGPGGPGGMPGMPGGPGGPGGMPMNPDPKCATDSTYRMVNPTKCGGMPGMR